MSIFLQNRRSRPRRFSYEPRYYDPEKDENLKRRMHVGRRSTSRRRSKSSILTLVILLGFAVYIYILLT